jgi:hypothetical protein
MSRPRAAKVRGDQNGHATGLEVSERPRSCALALVAVNDGRRDAGAFEMVADAIRAALGLAEDERLTGRVVRQEIREHGPLLIDRRRVHVVGHGRGDGLPVRDVNPGRVASEFGSESDHGIGQRRREEQCLTPSPQRRHHASQRGQKAHVQHTVCLVQREDFNRGEIDGASLKVVDQTPRSRDHDLDPTLQRLDLCPHADTTIDRRDSELRRRSVGGERTMDLGRQLTRRHENGPRGCRGLAPSCAATRRSIMGRPNAAVFPVPV